MSTNTKSNSTPLLRPLIAGLGDTGLGDTGLGDTGLEAMKQRGRV